MCGIGALLICKKYNDGNNNNVEDNVKNNNNDNINNNNNNYEQQTIIQNMSNKIYRRGPDSINVIEKSSDASIFQCLIVGSVLHLRGEKRVDQPFVDNDNQNTFCWNGEVFGDFPHVNEGQNDTILVYASLKEYLQEKIYNNNVHANLAKEKLIESLGTSILSFFAKIEGPYSFIYYDHATSMIWWGRDSQGRRSLVYNMNTMKNRLIISSTSFQMDNAIGKDDIVNSNNVVEWQDVPTTGIFCASCLSPTIQIKEFNWESTQRVYFNMASRKDISPPDDYIREKEYDVILCNELQKAITRRLPDNIALMNISSSTASSLTKSGSDGNNNSNIKKTNNVVDSNIYQTNSKIAVLFSGGLDSTVVAALLDKQYEKDQPIDLLNVCFDYPRHKSPDRVTALASYVDLCKQFPNRKWNLILINVTLDEVLLHQKHLLDLIAPMKSQMDFNIGAALWFAARGKGYLFDPNDEDKNDANKDKETLSSEQHQMPCQSNTRIIFTGVGADEQLGGYGRHRSSFLKHGGWTRLQEELVLDTNRLWLRNHGRDDRCISDHGKEPRYPFLDENVVRALSEIPLWEITDPRLEKGYGDKLILRHVANRLGLKTCSILPKRAIQFGSRIAKQSAKRAKRDRGTRHVKGTDVFEVVS